MKPIIMSTEDVRAVLDGRKTMTAKETLSAIRDEDRKSDGQAERRVRRNDEQGDQTDAQAARKAWGQMREGDNHD